MALQTPPATLTIIALLLIIHTSHQSSILDFQYAEYSQAFSQNYEHNADFNFTPTEIPEEKLKFPQACNALDMLNETKKEEEIQ
jgi:hypothetical protein